MEEICPRSIFSNVLRQHEYESLGSIKCCIILIHLFQMCHQLHLSGEMIVNSCPAHAPTKEFENKHNNYQLVVPK